MQAVQAELAATIEASQYTDAALDQRATDAAAQAATLKAARPTGSL